MVSSSMTNVVTHWPSEPNPSRTGISPLLTHDNQLRRITKQEPRVIHL